MTTTNNTIDVPLRPFFFAAMLVAITASLSFGQGGDPVLGDPTIRDPDDVVVNPEPDAPQSTYVHVWNGYPFYDPPPADDIGALYSKGVASFYKYPGANPLNIQLHAPGWRFALIGRFTGTNRVQICTYNTYGGLCEFTSPYIHTSYPIGGTVARAVKINPGGPHMMVFGYITAQSVRIVNANGAFYAATYPYTNAPWSGGLGLPVANLAGTGRSTALVAGSGQYQNYYSVIWQGGTMRDFYFWPNPSATPSFWDTLGTGAVNGVWSYRVDPNSQPGWQPVPPQNGLIVIMDVVNNQRRIYPVPRDWQHLSFPVVNGKTQIWCHYANGHIAKTADFVWWW